MIAKRRAAIASSSQPDPIVPRALLLVAGGGLIAFAALYNELLLAPVFGPLGDDTRSSLRTAQLTWVGVGVALVLASESVRRNPTVAAVFARGPSTALLLAALSIAVPLLVAELALQPFAAVEPRTRLFQKDAELGWTMVPGTSDLWSGVTISVNSKGLRGPEIDYARAGDALRILYLGDSVTFGYSIEAHSDTYPYLVEDLLERQLGRRVETVNAAVSGYSPWQQRLFLEREGLRYEPDLVVVGFVLNDVTEKLGLARFGGRGEGWQLEHTAASSLDALLSRSAVVGQARRLVARVRFGSDPEQAARLEELSRLHALLNDPDRPDIHEAWQGTLDNLDGIFALCRERDLPVLLLIFPITAQLEKVAELSHPQRRLIAFSGERGVPALDLLPLFAAEIQAGGHRIEDYFLDWNHPTRTGNRAAAAWIAPAIAEASRAAQ